MPDLSGSRSDPVGTPRLTGMESLAGVMASRPGDYLASDIFAQARTPQPVVRDEPPCLASRTVSAAVLVGARSARLPRQPACCFAGTATALSDQRLDRPGDDPKRASAQARGPRARLKRAGQPGPDGWSLTDCSGPDRWTGRG
jgi:hypothetical protein